MIREMFGITSNDKYDTTKTYSRMSASGGTGIFIHNPLEVKNVIASLIQPDFKVLSGNQASNILHRKVGERDLYFVYGLPKGTECSFRCTGKVELWNPWTGEVSPLKVSAVSEMGTTIALPLEKNEPQLIVFSPGKPEIETASALNEKPEELVIDNKWEFELKPTLNNQFGDYRLPAFDGKLGVEVWKMKFAPEATASSGCQKSDFDDGNWADAWVSYGQQFWKLGPFSADADLSALEANLKLLKVVDPSQPVEINGKKYFWKPYEFSWRWGLKDDAGHQGYHGLKGEVNNELISFGMIDKSRKHMPVYPLTAEHEGTVYYLWTAVVSPAKQEVQIKKGGLLPVAVWVNQNAIEVEKAEVGVQTGANPVLLKYKGVGRGYFVFEQSATVKKFEKPVSLANDWYLNPTVLPFNCNPQQKGQFGWYRFEAPPGAKSMFIPTVSKPEVWVSGEKVNCAAGKLQAGRLADQNLPVWKIDFPIGNQESAVVAVRLEQTEGVYGGAAIPEPVVFECEIGTIQLGDLSENKSLQTYSGGMWYRKTITFTSEQVKSKQMVLDLGKVVASAEVFVNGKSVGSKATSPWKFDMTGKLAAGENRIEILVYNTLGNHYLTTPSQYIGRINSGLIGPVKVEFHSK
jgi:hypothetical protein